MKELLKLINSLSEREQERLLQALEPVVKARKAYMDFMQIQQPKDLKTLADIETKRDPLLQSDRQEDKAMLEPLTRELQAIRKVIAGHTEKRVSLNTAYRNALKRFAGVY